MAVNSLAEYKKELVARSDAYRHAMAVEVHHIKSTTAWIPRTVHMVRWASPLLMVAAPVAGLLLGRRLKARPAAHPPRKGLLARVLAGVAMYRKVRSIVDLFGTRVKS